MTTAQMFTKAIALPLAIRLITHNIRYATSWPETGEGTVTSIKEATFHFNIDFIPFAVLWQDRKHLLISQHVRNALATVRHGPLTPNPNRSSIPAMFRQPSSDYKKFCIRSWKMFWPD